jgi:N-acetylglutamate synthase-like GNAT family acetyltransferase
MPGIGLVFRRLASNAERGRAARLVQAAGLTMPGSSEATWFGLWDVAAVEGADLVGVAATHPSGRGVVELDALAVPAPVRRRGYGRRLLAEVVNRARADGAERLLVRLPAGSGVQGLLSAAGFRADEAGQDPDRTVVLWWLEL